MKEFICKSIQRKFLAIMLFALVAVNGPLLTVFALVTSHSIEREVRAKKEAILDTNSNALSKPLWDFDFANLSEWAETIALDPDVALVEIFNDKGDLLASASHPSQPAAGLPAETLDEQRREIFHEVDGQKYHVGLLRIAYRGDQIKNAVWREVGKSALLFVVSIIAVLVTALFANKVMIVAPLSRLTSAIDATRRQGKRHRVALQASDEFGQVIHNFNEMQDRLDEDEEKLRSAHERVTFLYHTTPVMLYSVRSDDIIQWVSDYWLRATGYESHEVVGRPFTDFILKSSRRDYLQRTPVSEIAPDQTVETYCVFIKKDGSHVNVLISETADLATSAGLSCTLSVMTDITELKAAEAAILKQAQTDSLTGLANRAGFSAKVEGAIVRATAAGQKLCMLFFDLDHFKWVNDNLGHEVGDKVLESVARRILPLLQKNDLLARLGGDEFALVLSGDNLESRAIDLASLIKNSLRKPIFVDGRKLSVNASIGISFFPDDATTADELLRTSDVAMYQQKQGGRSGFCLLNEQMGRKASRHLEVQQYIIDGLHNDWFALHFQPIVNMQTCQPIGFEGLLRLDHPTEGRIFPDEIIAVAEENGLILDIGDKVIDLGIEQLQATCRDAKLKDTYIGINLSAAQFLPSLPAKLATRLMTHNIRPERLVLEITESVLMQDNLELDRLFADIRTLGCKFALDDFGTGYSSLSYMNRFPVDFVKIDRSFTILLDDENHSEVSRRTLSLIQGILILARELKLGVVAEGIETEAQYHCLKEMGVDAGQGYYFGKPEQADHYLTNKPAATLDRKRLHHG
ncbi:MAG: EAL domain-containing protein [Fimbriimonadaceae bacterium]|nr:EAL domain-containing protein [Alphaproteobacteria bacterium]